MRNLIGLIVFLAAVVVQAEGPVLATFDYAKQPGGRAPPHTIYKYVVGVDEGGIVELNVYRINTSTGSTSFYRKENKDISKTAGFKSLISNLAKLSDTEVQTTRRTRVCTMMPSASGRFRNLSVKEAKGDKLRLVLSNEACWMKLVTKPTDEKAATTAREVKAKLESLGNSFKL